MPQARRDKAKTRDYRCRITVQRLVAVQARLQDLDLAVHKHRQKMENPSSRGRSMILRVDKFHAQQHGLEKEPVPHQVPPLLVFPPRPGTPDDYHSAREPLEFEYDSEETNELEEDAD